jgi:hypothetical protein
MASRLGRPNLRSFPIMRHDVSSFTLRTASIATAVTALALTAVGVQAQGQLTVAPSGRGTTEVTIQPADAPQGTKPTIIRIDYGQPHLRGRQLHTGDLVPYDEPWRLGANAATTLTTDHDLVIGGAAIPKGRYVLRALPTRTAWTLLVEKEQGQSPMGAAPGDKPAEVVARINLEHTTLDKPLESLSMWLIPSTKPGAPHGELRFAWGTDMLSTDWTTK